MAKEDEEWATYTGEDGTNFLTRNTWKDVTRVRVGPNITAIHDGAFAQCGKLKEVDLSDNIAIIGEGAFEGCKSLERIIITVTTSPSATTITAIGANAFYDCHKLKELDFLSNVITVGQGAFRFCTSLKYVTISSNDETTIGAHAFHGCTQLKEVKMTNVAAIGEKALGWCTFLERVVVISSNTSSSSGVVICADAYAFCTGLKEVDVSNATTIIGEGAFQYCTWLERVRTPSTVNTGIDAPASASLSCAILDRAFDRCIRLKDVDLSNVDTIGKEAFHLCSSLESIVIPSTVTVINSDTFHGCTKLKKVGLCEGLQIIEQDAFRDCISLERLCIPSTVAAIGANAFVGCTQLKEVTLCEGGFLEIKQSTFQNCTCLPCINIPSVAFVIRAGAFVCHLLENATIAPTLGQIVISKCLKSLSLNDLNGLEERIDEVLNWPGLTREEKLDQIRGFFTYYELIEATTVLELAIWKANIDENNERDSKARQRCRRKCGASMNIIMKEVLKFFIYSNT